MLKLLTKTKPWMVASLIVATSVFGQDSCNPCPKPCAPKCEKPCPPPCPPKPCGTPCPAPECKPKCCPTPCPQPCPPTQWESAKYIDLLNRSALCRDSEERKGILREAELILMEQMPIIPIFHFALNYLERDGLEEVALSPLGQIDFRWAHFVPSTPL